MGLRYVQLEEALGRPPEMKELRDKFTYRSRVIAAEDDEAWRIYVWAVEHAKAEVTREGAKAVVAKQPVAPAEIAKSEATPSSGGAVPERSATSALTQRDSEVPQRPPEPQRHEGGEKKRSWLDRLLGRR